MGNVGVGFIQPFPSFCHCEATRQSCNHGGHSSFVFPYLMSGKKAKPEFTEVLNLKLVNNLYR